MQFILCELYFKFQKSSAEYNHMVANSMDQLRPFFTHRPIHEEGQPLAENVGQIDFILMTSEDDLVTHHCHVFNKNQLLRSDHFPLCLRAGWRSENMLPLQTRVHPRSLKGWRPTSDGNDKFGELLARKYSSLILRILMSQMRRCVGHNEV